MTHEQNLPDKRKALFDDFWAFHLAHPELRFWQAVREWSGKQFILVSDTAPHEWNGTPYLGHGKGFARVEDTFYWETKDGNE